ncbi:hypothetical protein [Alcanivorax borkumensis]|jgi:hypothetical protein|uniref:hypothetical protein n=1 Tax=Alcanivorax borkumensis TaxID=59754 RepID=UPI003EEF6EA4
MAEVFISVALSIISLVGGALIAVNINYAVSKEDAVEALKGLGRSAVVIIFKIWVVFTFLLTLYYLGDLLLGDEQLTKKLLLQVVVLMICIILYLVAFASLVALSLFRKILDVQSRHLAITEKAFASLVKIDNSGDET